MLARKLEPLIPLLDRLARSDELVIQVYLFLDAPPEWRLRDLSLIVH